MEVNINPSKHNIFLTWKTTHPQGSLGVCVEAWRKTNQHNNVYYFDDSDACKFISYIYSRLLPIYLNYPKGILRADIWRVLVLFYYGGVYADIDVEPLQDITRLLDQQANTRNGLLLPTDHPIHSRIHYGGRKMWMNDFMIAKPGSRFLKRVIDAFVEGAGKHHRPEDAVWATGPGLFTRLIEEAGGPEAAGVTEIPWQLIHPLPDMSNGFAERAEYEQMIRDGSWKTKYNPIAVHYWHHTWCRSGNTLKQYGDLLLTTDGQRVEDRLQAFVPHLEVAGKDRVETTGMALSELAQRELGSLVELGVTRSFVPAGTDGHGVADSKFYNSDAEAWDWDAGSFTKLAAEVLRGLDFQYHGVDSSPEAIATAHHMVCDTPGIQVKDISTPLEVAITAEPADPPIPYGKVLRADNSLQFHVSTAEDFLRVMNFQAGLIHMDHGDSSEDTARQHEIDAQIILDRDLVKPGGLVLIDDHGVSDGVANSCYSLPLFRAAGYKVLAEGYQILLERPLGPEKELPQILHRFPSDKNFLSCMGIPGVEYGWRLPDWEERRWDLKRMDAFVEAEAQEVSEAYFQLRPELRLRAGRMVVANKLGGVVMVEGTPMPENFAGQVMTQKLAFFPQKDAAHNLLDVEEALSPRIFASTVNHPFWRGVETDWFTEDAPLEKALASGFLTRRVKDSLRFLQEADQPKVLRMKRLINPLHLRNLHYPEWAERDSTGTVMSQTLPSEYDDVFPTFPDSMMTDYEAQATPQEREYIEKQFRVAEIIAPRKSAHVMSVSLFWKELDDWSPDLPKPTLERMKNEQLGRGIIYDRYVLPVLQGAKTLAEQEPEASADQ